ncbi:MAG: aldehyde dehydrogenase family protein, partial [Bacteroidetes bacterium]|nr:aldehyde dehydrogenase family protein [Bacteroidota bacterium]
PSLYKRVALEMGGKNSVIVLKDADIDLAVAGIMRSVFATSGQRCASAGKIIVEREVSDELTERLVNAANKLKVGNGIDPETELGPVINKVRLKNIEADVNRAVEQGANILCGGKIAGEGELKNGNFFLPTFMNNVTPDMEIARTETFGPVASIITVNGPKEAIAVANNVRYGLTGAVFTQDIDKAMIIRDEVEVGVFFINAACVGGELSAPFGGFKASGNGKREGSHAMLDIYTEWKTVYIQHKPYDSLK